MADSFSVVPFTAESFSLQLVSEGCTEADVATDERVTYLAAYLGAIEIKTIVTEHEYTDADYLDDYASFYAKSFGSISNRCRRLHFFRIDFTEEAFHFVIF